MTHSELNLGDLAMLEKVMPDREKAERLRRSRTLVLNADYLPISSLPLHTVDWKEAVILVYMGKCKVLDSYEDLTISSAHTAYRVPSVLVNSRYVRPKRKVEFSRNNIFLRDDYKCQYCGKNFSAIGLTFDHYVPRAEGGKTNWGNIITACRKCNHIKGTQNRRRWKARRAPYIPDFYELEGKAKKRTITIPDPRWAKYLNWGGTIHVNNGVDAYDMETVEEYETTDEKYDK